MGATLTGFVIVLMSTSVNLPVTPRGVTVPVSCTGPAVVAGKKIAAANGLKHGLVPGACFGAMNIYAATDTQYVAIAPSKACPKGKALDVFGKSRAGPWYSYFEKPVCGAGLVIGPKNQWGDWMLTVDGRRYDSRGAYYVPVQ